MGSPSRPLHRRWARSAAAAAWCGALVAAASDAAGDDPSVVPATDKPDERDTHVGPPDTRRSYLQYGAAFTVEDVLSPGPICSASPCILGSGGGIAGRAGFRATERFYIGGSYELSKQEPNKLYLLGILQQVRGEVRSYFPTGQRTTPFFMADAGVAGYGNEWAVDTWGPAGGLGGGIEIQLSGGSLLDLSMLYRAIFFQSYVDSSLTPHGAGISQFFGLQLAVEAQDAL